jgi:hypothetical protein
MVRLGVLPEQVREFGLVENPAKDQDSNIGRFIAEFGSPVQVEAEALAVAVGGLENLVRPEVEARLDLDLIEEQRWREQQMQRPIAEALAVLADEA